MGSRSRRKGAKFERDLAEILRILWPEACRGLGQTRSGSVCADVEGTPCWVEAKVGARPNPRAAMDQAEAATDGRPVLVVVRDNGAGSRAPRDFVAMPLTDFLRLIEMERGAEESCPLSPSGWHCELTPGHRGQHECKDGGIGWLVWS